MCERVCVCMCLQESGSKTTERQKREYPGTQEKGQSLGHEVPSMERQLSWWPHPWWHSGFHIGSSGPPRMPRPCRYWWTGVWGDCLWSGMGLGTVTQYSWRTVPVGPPLRPAEDDSYHLALPSQLQDDLSLGSLSHPAPCREVILETWS